MKDKTKDDQNQAVRDENDAPAVYSVDHIDGQPKFSRRSFLQMAAVAAGATALSNGCCCLTGGWGKMGTGPAIAHNDAVTALAINTTGKLLASGDKKGTLKLWQLPEGALLHSWSGCKNAILDLAFPHMGETLWSLDSLGNMKRWHLPDGKEIPRGESFSRTPRSFVFAVPNKADWYASQGRRHNMELRSQTTGKKLGSIEGLNDEALVMTASLDGRFLLAGGKNGNLGLWTQPENTLVQTVSTGPKEVSALTVDPKGTLALSAHANGRLRSWHLPELHEGAAYESNLGELFSVAIRPQLDIFAVGSEKPEIELWNLDTTNW